jgi:mRNA interferase RelE/StbE
VTKLAGYANRWRVRIGDYRVIYQIDDQVQEVIVLRIAHRREAYR